jgi:hypothetical protein
VLVFTFTSAPIANPSELNAVSVSASVASAPLVLDARISVAPRSVSGLYS